MFNLTSIKTTKSRKRVGRGQGSGHGAHTVGRGQKGQKSRSGYKAPRKGFEGGSMPLSRRIPKLRGFTRGFLKGKVENVSVKLDDIANAYDKDTTVNFDTLLEKNLISGKSKNVKVKVLVGNTKSIDKSLKFENVALSASAKSIVEDAGGSVAN